MYEQQPVRQTKLKVIETHHLSDTVQYTSGTIGLSMVCSLEVLDHNKPGSDVVLVIKSKLAHLHHTCSSPPVSKYTPS